MKLVPSGSGGRTAPSGQTSPGFASGDDARTEHERPLAEMLSMSDWRSFVPETAGLLALLWLADAAYPAGLAAPGMPHPYWVPVLLMSCQYGVMAGLFATLAATAAFCLGGLPDRSAAQDFYAYAAVVAGQPCAWFGAALILGGLRTLHIHHQSQMREELGHTRRSAEDLADGLERAVGEIARLERRIATDCSTLTSFIHSLSKLDMSDRTSLADGLVGVIRHGVGATTFAVYLRSGDTLEPLLAVENGASLPSGALAPPDPSLFGGATDGKAIRNATLPGGKGDLEVSSRWSLILAPATGETLGVVVYAPLPPSHDQGAADRRLISLCRFLGVLLSTYPRPMAGVG